MNVKTKTAWFAAVLAVALAAVAVPANAVGGQVDDPGLVAGTLGSPDPRESIAKGVDAGAAATRLGTPDPRDTGLASISPSAVAGTLGSPDPRDTASVSTSAASAGKTFDWGDFGIGLGFGVGLSAILAGAIILGAVALRGRRVAHPLT